MIVLNMSKKIKRYPFEVYGDLVISNYPDRANVLRSYEGLMIKVSK